MPRMNITNTCKGKNQMEKIYSENRLQSIQSNKQKQSICGVWLHRYNVAFQTKISEQTKIM